MKKKYEVTGLGNAIVDLCAHVDESDLKALGLTKGEMRLVDADYQDQILSRIGRKKFSKAGGGSAANSIIACSMLGSRVAFCSVLGSDEYGDVYREDMLETGVDLYVSRTDTLPTGCCIVLVTPDGERTMLTFLGANRELSADHVSVEAISSSEWILLEAYLLSSERNRGAAREALRIAGESGTKIALSLSDVFIVRSFAEEIKRTVEASDLVFCNLAEAMCYSGETDESRAFEGLRSDVEGVALTKGERGVVVSFDCEDFEVSAVSTPVVDATGAGDAFAGGFLFGITSGLGPLRSANLGNALASSVVGKEGPRPNSDAVAKLLGLEVIER